MFSFSSFGVPIIFGSILLVALAACAGVTCVWDVWRRPLYYSAEISLPVEVPKMWDLVREDPVDGLWRSLLVCTCALERHVDLQPDALQPISMARLTTKPRQSAKVPAERPTPLQRLRHPHKHKASEIRDTSQDHVQIAVAIAMPCPPTDSHLNPTDEIDERPPVYCIGTHRTTVDGLDV
jgi:hypothetical protein